jgi:reactive intermediate/imine deaminase
MEIIQTKNMPESNGHYSQVIAHNGILYLSGQLPMNPKSKKIPETIEDQTKQALDNVLLLLKEAGSSKDDVLQMRIYVSDIRLWNKVNTIYCNFFGEHRPVRCIVAVNELHFGCFIEIEAVAVQNY